MQVTILGLPDLTNIRARPLGPYSPFTVIHSTYFSNSVKRMSVNFVYPDQQIPLYFKQSPLTQVECNEKILNIFLEEFCSTFDKGLSDSEIRPSIFIDHGEGSFQGCYSYTVSIRSGPLHMIGQYRKASDRIDPHIIENAVAGYKHWVLVQKFFEDPEWQITISPYAGVSYARQDQQYSFEHKLNSITDFGRFIALGCFAAQDSSPVALQHIYERLSMWANWSLSEKISTVIKITFSELCIFQCGMCN
jgi:hypothetical protein